MGNRPLLMSVSNMSRVHQTAWAPERLRYHDDTYFRAEEDGARLLRMKCDNRFTKGDDKKSTCAPLNSPVISADPRGRVFEFQNNNPSIVRIHKGLRKLLPVGEFLVIKCTAHLLCENTVSGIVPRRPSLEGTTVVQLMDDKLQVVAQTHVEICPTLYAGQRSAVGLDELHYDTLYEKKNIWFGGMNAFARRYTQGGGTCGVLAAEDARVFYVGGQLYIMTFCHVGTCRGQEDIFRTRLHVHMSGDRLVAYVVQSTKIMIPQFGRNFNFFTSRNTSYMLTSLYNMDVVNLKTGLPAATRPLPGIEESWHLHGGQLVAWKGRRRHGFLGIAHKHGPMGKHRVPWGSRYISAFYLLSDREPFEVLRWGTPFCFSSPGREDKCEGIQFVSSVIVWKGHVIIGYGVNDCESRFWIMSIEEVNSMLDAADTANANATAPGAAAAAASAAANPVRSYLRESYFEPELRDAFLLKMSCDDPRFPNCRPRTPVVSHTTDQGTHAFVNFNPSVVPIEPFMRAKLPYGASLALLRLVMDYCAGLRSYGARKDPNEGGIIVQVLGKSFEVLAQTYIELCSAHPPEDEYVDLDSVIFAPKNIWWGDMNAYPPVDRRAHACGLLAGEDTRVFYVGQEMWLLNSCFEGGSCKGYWNDIYRVPLYVRASGNATHPRLRAYVVSPKTPLAPLGKNFVFFEAQQRRYMMLNIHKMELHNMGTGLPARSIMPNLGLFGAKTVMGEGAHNWHLQGGALVAWNTKRHSGLLGVAHRHIGEHGKNFARFGSRYVTALYLISTREPFALVKFSHQFCFASLEYPNKCEVIQFVSTLFMSQGRLIVGYGVNDCESRLWSLSVEEVDKLLAGDSPYRLDDYMRSVNSTLKATLERDKRAALERERHTRKKDKTKIQ